MSADTNGRQQLHRHYVEFALRELTANLLRVMRGAGRPGEIADQARSLVATINEYRDEFGAYPASEEWALFLATWPDPGEAVGHARQRIIRGVLQIVVARLLGQRTQEAAGDQELLHGVRELGGARPGAD